MGASPGTGPLHLGTSTTRRGHLTAQTRSLSRDDVDLGSRTARCIDRGRRPAEINETTDVGARLEVAQIADDVVGTLRARTPIARQSVSGGAQQHVLNPGGDSVAVLGGSQRRFSRTRAHDDRDGGAKVLCTRLVDLFRRITVCRHGVGDRIAETGPSVALGNGEAPRPRPLVVRCPLRQLTQFADQFARHSALPIDEHAGAAATDQVCEVGRLHALIIAPATRRSPPPAFRGSEQRS